MKYEPEKIEKKWQAQWEESKIYRSPASPRQEKKTYVLGMFPYPSGAGLHIGHVRIYTAVDVLARYFRMRGQDVLNPIGWDAFGLPAENAAIRERKNPSQMVSQNEANFKRQCQALGFSYDWEREFSTTDPQYYRWTQWLFLQFYQMKNEQGKRLIYRKIVPINWCPFCQTGLADEEVLPDGCHERCGKEVTKKEMPQWLFRITDYADRLLQDLAGLNWPEGILALQKNWIGRSEGAEIKFSIFNSQFSISVFTTRPDTIFGATFFILAPEHPLVEEITVPDHKDQVLKYVEQAKKKSELKRIAEIKDKSGVFTGGYVLNPANNEKIPVWVADFVLLSYATGAIMAVPAHSQRDWDFARKYQLLVRQVVAGGNVKKAAYLGQGKMVNSGKFTGLANQEAKRKIVDWLRQRKLAKPSVSYHLRDWIFSRQRYWGEPIPLVYCQNCGDENGVVPVLEKDLPLKLPYVEKYEPTGTGESPLAAISEWVNTLCPQCRGPARRETDTMPNWAGSCWYFLRFADPKNEKEPFKKELADFWHPVDWYLGGAEHAVLHLLYARFWVKLMFDLGLVSFKEPFYRLRSVGMVLGEGGRKMSKSLGNIVNPDEVVKEYGADTLRVFEMFIGPWSQAIAWNNRGIKGAWRFLGKVWQLFFATIGNQESSFKVVIALNKLIQKVSADIPDLKFNTSIAAMMEFINLSSIEKQGIGKDSWEKFLLVLAPFAPFLAEELWHQLGNTGSVHQQSWPEYDDKLTRQETVTIIIQVSGKVRGEVKMKNQISKVKENVENEAKKNERVAKYLEGKQIKKVIFVPGKLINFVI